jgi:hypothetical protein
MGVRFGEEKSSSRTARGGENIRGGECVRTAEMCGVWRERCAHLAERDGCFAGALAHARGCPRAFHTRSGGLRYLPE